MAKRATEMAAAQDVETYAALRETFGSLHAVLGSHVGYEETELHEAFGVYGAI